MSNWYHDTFGNLLLEIEQGLQQYCNGRPQVASLLTEMIDFHFAWDQLTLDEDGKPVIVLERINGKRSRPLMALLVADGICSQHSHALPAAVGIELIHNFTLMHDDIMDESDERRHRPTLWRKWGISQAINAGDGLFAYGMHAVLELMAQSIPTAKTAETLRVLLEACMATVEGQMLDIDFETRIDVNPDEYLTMVYHKSGALIEASARMGALLSTDDAVSIQAYADFARYLGIAFQIQDDYLGVWGDESITGKSATSDIEGKKKSYPVLLAFQQASAESKDRLAVIYNQDVVNADAVNQVLSILDEVEARSKTRDLIQAYYKKSLNALDRVQVGERKHDLLVGLARFLIQRAY